MKKAWSIVFSLILMCCLIATCAFNAREIGADLYKLYKNEIKNISLKSFDKLVQTVDSTLSDNFIIHGACIDTYGLIQKLEGKRTVIDADPDKTVIKGNDGKLYFASNVLSEDDSATGFEENIDSNVSCLLNLNNFCKNRNISLLYVNAPAKRINKADGFNYDSFDFYSKKSKYTEEQMNRFKINNLNLMSSLQGETSVYSDGFFATDHHWTIKTAFWAHQKICLALNELFDYDIDKKYYDLDNFEIETYKKSYLGSMGTRVGKYYAGIDDIDIIFPKFDTDFKIQYETKTLNKSVKEEGPFDEVIHKHTPDYYYITSDNSIVNVDNLLINSGHKVLLIKDSFGVPVSGWMSCWADELTIMDLRYKQEKSVEDVISEKDIDTVIIIYNAEMLENRRLFIFDTKSEGK